MGSSLSWLSKLEGIPAARSAESWSRVRESIALSLIPLQRIMNGETQSDGLLQMPIDKGYDLHCHLKQINRF